VLLGGGVGEVLVGPVLTPDWLAACRRLLECDASGGTFRAA
jgi:hypothetical protein